jgi:branched-chain amino acid aminotransferase
MYLNINSEIIIANNATLNIQNRGFKYGDAVFDTLKSNKSRIFFIEEHYFRLMSSLRMLRMEIPGNFTLEFYEDQISKTLKANNISGYGRIRVTVFRKEGGLFNPKTSEIEYIIETENLRITRNDTYEIELYKDFPVTSSQLSNIKTNNRILNVIAGIFADENSYDNCILLNERKHIAEAINGNIFLIKDGILTTPPLADGCINGIIRNQIITYLKKIKKYKIAEISIAPIELLHADEVIITNSIIGIQNVTKYRKKNYDTKIGKELNEILIRSEKN